MNVWRRGTCREGKEMGDLAPPPLTHSSSAETLGDGRHRTAEKPQKAEGVSKGRHRDRGGWGGIEESYMKILLQSEGGSPVDRGTLHQCP